MIVSRAHIIRLNTNLQQFSYCSKSAGVARFAYNWALAEWKKQYIEYKSGLRDNSPNEAELRKLFNKLKHIQAPTNIVLSLEEKRKYFSFVNDVSKYCSQQAIKNLGTAFNKFFNHLAKYPKFKKKGQRDSFYIGNDAFKIIEKNNKQYLKLPNLKQPIELAEKLRFDGKVNNLVISRKANHWFVSFSVQTDIKLNNTPQVSCGVDLGISKLATVYDSNGKITIFENPKGYRKHLKRLKRLQKSHSRKLKASKNKKKSQMKLAKLHLKIVNIREDNIHKMTTYLVKNYNLIKLEDLNVKGMMKNHKLAGAISDASFYKITQNLAYKSQLQGSKIEKVDRFFASSKICNECGLKNINLKLSHRRWTCDCGASHDRDENAAKNILAYKKEVKIPIANGKLKSVETKGSVLTACAVNTTLSVKQKKSNNSRKIKPIL